MPYVCSDPDEYNDGQHHGESQECVALVKEACGISGSFTNTAKKGVLVKGTNVAKGAAIATFNASGHYEGHAAIYLGQTADGILVLDQWKGHGAQQRVIRYGGNGVSNNGNGFYVVN